MQLKEITPDDMLARVLHRDGLMLIVDKPAGLAVFLASRTEGRREPRGPFRPPCRFGLPRPPALAHRLDKDTSG